MTHKAVSIKNTSQKYQIIYCRYFNRKFDNSKIGEFVDVNNFHDPKEGLREACGQFICHPTFDNIDWKIEAWNDRAAREHTPFREITGKRDKIKYIAYRYNLIPLIHLLKWWHLG